MVEIRNLKREDVEEALELLRSCFDRFELEEITPANLLEWTRQFSGGVKVAVENGRVIGFVFAFAHQRVGWITFLCVRREFRRRGIGAKLLEQAVEYLKGRGVQTVKLDVEPRNPAVKLYRKFGFELERQLLRLRKEFKRSLG